MKSETEEITFDMKKTIAVLPGDGIGPEVINEAVKVLTTISKTYKHEFSFKEVLIGAAAIEKTGKPLPKETVDLCFKSDAILFGAIGDPKYDNDPLAKIRPEQGLLQLRKTLGLYANIRPVFTFSGIDKSPLKPEITNDVDLVFVRELTGGLYFGEPRGRKDNGNTAYETNIYTKDEILRVTKLAFDLAKTRKKKVTLVDKANVLETSRLWLETVREYAKNFPEITVEYMFVDNASMQLIKRPSEFDVILTDNMFGDILTDEASVIAGSLGLLPSASIGTKTSLYEPIHGSFPKAAGKNTANPTGAILSIALMLEYSFGLKKESQTVLQAVKKAIKEGFGTKDIQTQNPFSTIDFGDKVVSYLTEK